MWKLICLAVNLAAATEDVYVVNISGASLGDQVAVQTCSGLFNRDTSVAGASFVLGLQDVAGEWLSEVQGITTTRLSIQSYMDKCLSSGVAQGYIRYASWEGLGIQTLPNAVTLAGVLDAVLLDDSMHPPKGLPMLRDLSAEWAGWSELTATEYMYENYVNQTTGLVKTDPGWDVRNLDQFTSPKIVNSIDVNLFDYVVKQRLFDFFLLKGCVPLTKEHELTNRMADSNPWQKPVAVYGYDDTVAFQGDLFEAETKCTSSHNWGQVASNGATNMAFFSRMPPIASTLPQNQEPSTKYNASKTYIAFVVGDGDNVDIAQTDRRHWMEHRVSMCKAGKGCWPLLWTLNPHLSYMAPEMVQWFYKEALKTGSDFFVLPPSGHTYSYPSEQSEPDLSNFVRLTEQDAKVMGTSAMVSWEWWDSWHSAMKNYFPKYAAKKVLRSAYAVNVPYLFDTLVTWKYKTFTVLDGFVLFRPHEWRGTSGSKIPGEHDTMLSAAEMASQINNYARGTVTHIYLTSDGGANIGDLYDLVAALDSHVEVVSHNVLADMALAHAAQADRLDIVV